MAGTYQDFEGDDNLIGFTKYVGEILVYNELGGVSDGYTLEHADAGGSQSTASGYSFGGNQMDLANNSAARALLRDILQQARDSQGNLIIENTVIGGTTFADGEAFYNSIASDLLVKGNPDLLTTAEKNIINECFQTVYGKIAINLEFVLSVQDNISHINSIVSSLSDGIIKDTLLGSEEIRLVLSDYHNQFDISTNGLMHKFLKGESVAMFSGNTLQLDGTITIEDVIEFVANTKWGIEAATAFNNRYSATQNYIAENGIGKLLIDDSTDSTIIGGINGDTLDGGAGNDTLHGGTGSDEYRFSGDFGIDEIHDDGLGNTASGPDKIMIEGVRLEGLGVKLPPPGWEPGDPPYASPIYWTLQGQKIYVEDGYIRIETANGTIKVFDWTPGAYGIELNGYTPPPPPTGGQDISGTSANDMLLATSGYDTVTGGLGADTFVWAVEAAATGTITDFSSAEEDKIDLSAFTHINGFDDLVISGGGDAPSDPEEPGAPGEPPVAASTLMMTEEDFPEEPAPGDGEPGEPGGGEPGGGEPGSGSEQYALIDLGDGQVLRLEGVDYTQLTADDFIFYVDDTPPPVEGVSLSGGNGKDTLTGSEGDDTLDGGNGKDALYGDEGNDILEGGNGNDLLSGGAGMDILTGGNGSDIFVFSSLDHSTNGAADTITDFGKGNDHIDLSGLGFTGIQSGTANGDVLGYTVIDGNTVIEADDSDFSLVLTGDDITLTNDDFVF